MLLERAGQCHRLGESQAHGTRSLMERSLRYILRSLATIYSPGPGDRMNTERFIPSTHHVLAHHAAATASPKFLRNQRRSLLLQLCARSRLPVSTSRTGPHSLPQWKPVRSPAGPECSRLFSPRRPIRFPRAGRARALKGGRRCVPRT